jgi:hypothetical protein
MHLQQLVVVAELCTSRSAASVNGGGGGAGTKQFGAVSLTAGSGLDQRLTAAANGSGSGDYD